MASRDGDSGIGLLGVLVGALIVAAFAYFLIGDRIGLREATDVNVRVEAPKAPTPPTPTPAPVTPKSQ
jgi:hypothetical protein